MLSPTEFPQASLIPVNGITLEVFEAGQENAGNPIILCHGWPELAYSWRFQVPALVEAGYHVIIPNQRGYGNSSCPSNVTAYDITQLTGDLTGLLDHYGYAEATFIGHDWGAMVVWWLTLLHPARVKQLINLSVPYQERWEKPWIEMMQMLFGDDFYFVHFNRQPGVADAVLDANTAQFLGNLYCKNLPPVPPAPGMMMINLAQETAPLGESVMNAQDLAVYVAAFEKTGFSSSINWYRNLDRNWHILADVPAIIQQPALMIYGAYDPVAKSETLPDFVPNVDVASLPCGHWVQQELPEETNKTILEWLAKQAA